MPRKKKEEIEETTANTAAEETETAETVAADAGAAEEKAAGEEQTVLETVADAVAGAVETVADAAASVVNTVSQAVSGNGDQSPAKKARGNRSERIGIVASDKMEKTVTVRVERQVKHPIYRKYIKRRKKFMAHDELGATVGDKVRIVETRPLSARKRWRVVEIIQKAEK
jgi:small subunit ribosomal protein S17